MLPTCPACRASVQPRTVSPETGESILLEDAVVSILQCHRRGVIQIVGGPGAGKTTALQHLAAVLPPLQQVRLLDDPPRDEVVSLAAVGLVVCAVQPTLVLSIETLATLPLAPWGRDEAIEYLLAEHRGRCASVMGRLGDSGAARRLLKGVPELWRIVLERMARRDWLAGAEQALRDELALRLEDMETRRAVQGFCLTVLCESRSPATDELERFERLGVDPVLLRLCRHECVQTMVAGDGLLALLRPGSAERTQLRVRLAIPLPRDLIREVGKRADGESIGMLESLTMGQERACQPMAASILHATNTGWKPTSPSAPELRGAWLAGAQWPGVDLSGAAISGADFTGADLSGAQINASHAARAILRNARLAGAALRGTSLEKSDLGDADLTAADLSGADLSRADLQGARLNGAKLGRAVLHQTNLEAASCVGADFSSAKLYAVEIAEADFTGANFDSAHLHRVILRGAEFREATFVAADLWKCDLEFLDLPRPNFATARLKGALLTGSVMSRANFRGADLTDTGLADIQWEGADLRGADLRGCTFHMGSSRSGRLFTPIASEGTRTGFYTDEFEEQHFKSPEEIRKANLRGADLRDANTADVDFYLVDLRGARYSPQQRQHFARCGAILADPAG